MAARITKGDVAKLGAGAVLLLAIAAGLWHLAHDKSGIKREAPRIMAITPLPPPPPPPKQPEPPKPREETQQEIPKPSEQPKPAEDNARPVTIAGDAQAGSDAFNIGAGTGGGMVGSGAGLGNASYDRYLAYTLQQAIQKDARVNTLVFTLDVKLWLDESGRLTKVELVRGSGDDRTDRAVLASLQNVGGLDAPPSTLQFPQRLTIRGQRQG